MKANPSKSWKTEVLDVVEDHDFNLDEVYDAGSNYQSDDHQCDFCGTHLRYTAVIEAEDNDDINYDVGLDCLEHVMGTGWSHMQNVERQIEDLKEKAKKERRRKKYAEEYEEIIEWLEARLEIEEDSFLRDMYNILTTGESEFTQNMRDSVVTNIKNTDLDFLKKKQRRVSRWEERLENLLETIVLKDDIQISDRSDKDYPNPRHVKIGRPRNEGRSSYEFVQDVLQYLRQRNKLSENQMDALESVHDDYKKRDIWNEEENDEEEEAEKEKLPF